MPNKRQHEISITHPDDPPSDKLVMRFSTYEIGEMTGSKLSLVNLVEAASLDRRCIEEFVNEVLFNYEQGEDLLLVNAINQMDVTFCNASVNGTDKQKLTGLLYVFIEYVQLPPAPAEPETLEEWDQIAANHVLPSMPSRSLALRYMVSQESPRYDAVQLLVKMETLATQDPMFRANFISYIEGTSDGPYSTVFLRDTLACRFIEADADHQARRDHFNAWCGIDSAFHFVRQQEDRAWG